ncbi:Adenosine deaminase 2 [Colletotrichum sp. SAR 10_86]|nr:Adenosine deaminase 2 [Colletotrichum sp. SAR 10_65]KAI8186498.1 Adenosine deaminase 2 [Colletotrichum sp. SAR 10_75]KAI8220792.1 Adenosine deaminase 2 [Colletotrichum sp. SAR 10_86]
MHFSSLLAGLAFASPSLGYAIPLAKPALASRQWVYEIPSKDSIVIKQHEAARAALMQLEDTERQDAQFRKSLSEVCGKADNITRAIRLNETNTIWRENGGYAGEMFSKARETILQTKLWKIVDGMPKGALLHAHLTAMLPYDALLDVVMETENMGFWASQSLNSPEARNNSKFEFSYRGKDFKSAANPANVYAAEYQPYNSSNNEKNYMSVQAAADQYPGGGRKEFRKFVKSKMVVLPEEATHHELGVDDIWKKFQSAFEPAGTMLTYEPIVRRFWQLLFNKLAENRISWVEIRAGGSRGKLVPQNQVNATNDPSVWWTVMNDELQNFTSTRAENTTHPFHGARVIWSDSRSKTQSKLKESMTDLFAMKKKFPLLFSGYDVVAQEDLGRTLLDMAPELLWFQEEARRHDVTLPFFFHAGETLGDGNSTDDNLFDALLLGTRRIGHGFSLYKHPMLIDQAVKKNVMVEVCPISNEVLRLATDILHHPLPAMIAHGVPTAISNDDPAMLGQDSAGLSFDFYQVIQGFDNVGLAGLGALAQNSLRWSNFEDQNDKDWELGITLGSDAPSVKGARIREWNAQWNNYCQQIVDEYGAEWGS